MKTMTVAILHDEFQTEFLEIEDTEEAREILMSMYDMGTNIFDEDEYAKLNIIYRREADFELVTESRGY